MDSDGENNPSAPSKCRFSAPKSRQRSFTTPALMEGHHQDRHDLKDSHDALKIGKKAARLWRRKTEQVNNQ